MDAPSGDLGTPSWGTYGMVMAAPTLRSGWVADPGISEAFLVGHGGLIFHRVGNGDWKAEASGTDANLYALSGRGTAELFAVGERGVILRRSSGTWHEEGKELRLTSSLYGVAALPSGEVLAVGDLGVVARRQTSGVWTLETSGALGTASLRAVWGSQLEGAYAVGLGSVIVRRVAGAWQRDTLPIDAGGAGNYYAITGSADGAEVHIAGEYGIVLHRIQDGGGRWLLDKRMPPMGMTAPLHFFSLSLQQGELLVAGAGGTVLRRDSQGTWTVEPTGTSSDLYSLAGAGLRSVLAVGARGTILRRL